MKASAIRDPLVSVVMPAWNAAATIEKAAWSILNQTYRNLELIVVDDASTDSTAEIVGRIRDPRLRMLRLPERAGGAAARNAGIRAAAGELIAAMDADDVSHARRLERQVEFLRRRPDVGIVFCAFDCVDEAGRVLDRVYPPADDAEIRALLIRQNPFAHSTMLARRAALEAVGLYGMKYRNAQDYDLYLRIAQHWKLGCVSEVLHRVLVHPESETQRRENRICYHDVCARLAAVRRGQYPVRSILFLARTFASMLVPMALKRRLRAVRGHRYRYFRRELVPPPDAGETSGPFCGAPAPEEAVLWPFAGSIGAGATVLWLGQPASSGIAAGGFPGLLVTDAALPVSRPWGTAVRQDWSALPFRAAAFDLACADLDPASWDEARTRLCVRELRRVVKPGGSVFLRVGPWTGGKAQPWGRLSELVSSFLAARRIVSKLRVQLPVWGFAVEASYAAFPSAREPRYVIDARDWRSMSYLFFRLPVALERHVLGQALLRLVFAAATRLFDRRTETPAPAFALHGVAR